jgi:pyrimidine deaminase RibD-like protein
MLCPTVSPIQTLNSKEPRSTRSKEQIAERDMKLHQQATIYNQYSQSIPVILDCEVTDDGHVSGFANFSGGRRPDGFPTNFKCSVITNDPRAGILQQFLHLTIFFVNPHTAQVRGYINDSRAEFQNVETVKDIQAELDYRFAKMAIEAAKSSTAEDTNPRPKVGAVAVKHGQLLGTASRTAVEDSGKTNGQHAEFRLTTSLSGGDLDGATIYTTLEPCLNRNEPKTSCVDRLISVKVARVVIGALDPDHRGNGLRKLAHAPVEIAFFPYQLRKEARDLLKEWSEFVEKQKKDSTGPTVKTLRERILQHKGESIRIHNKKSDSYATAIIEDCDDEVVTLKIGESIFTRPLEDLSTTKEYLNGRMEFVLADKTK